MTLMSAVLSVVDVIDRYLKEDDYGAVFRPPMPDIDSVLDAKCFDYVLRCIGAFVEEDAISEDWCEECGLERMEEHDWRILEDWCAEMFGRIQQSLEDAGFLVRYRKILTTIHSLFEEIDKETVTEGDLRLCRRTIDKKLLEVFPKRTHEKLTDLLQPLRQELLAFIDSIPEDSELASKLGKRYEKIKEYQRKDSENDKDVATIPKPYDHDDEKLYKKTYESFPTVLKKLIGLYTQGYSEKYEDFCIYEHWEEIDALSRYIDYVVVLCHDEDEEIDTKTAHLLFKPTIDRLSKKPAKRKAADTE